MFYIELHGQAALWTHTELSQGRISAVGPAPSHIAGLISASFGFVAKHAGRKPPRGQTIYQYPLPAELLELEGGLELALRWAKLGKPERFSHNVNGMKSPSNFDITRITQTLIMEPKYGIAIRHENPEKEELIRAALKNPQFRIYLGSTNCSGFIQERPMAEHGWASWTENTTTGDLSPCTHHCLPTNGAAPEDRIVTRGYLNYLDTQQTPHWLKAGV